MARIHSISIKNFRGIKECVLNFYLHNFVCLVGRGDTGKSTILDAISYVLSPNWNVTFYDTDFTNCDIENPLEIVACLYDLPDAFLDIEKFGLYLKSINESGELVDELIDDDSVEIAISIHLKVEKDLEPKWYVKNVNSEEKEVRASDRAKLNTFLVSDFINQHFSWSRGTPLNALLKQEKKDNENASFISEAFREAKKKLDEENILDNDNSIIPQIVKEFAELGVSIPDTRTSIDFKDIIVKDGKLCLHDDKIPFRLKGKGTKRLTSIAIQLALTKKNKGIILIDELEQGLEPDRIKHLVRTLYTQNKGQIFITTHSQNVIEELESTNLFSLKKYDEGLVIGNFITDEKRFQKMVRACPQALYAKKVIVCEGQTEIGVCRALDSYRVRNQKKSMTLSDVVYVSGQGKSMIDRTNAIHEVGIPVILFCDSDLKKREKLKLKSDKALLASKGVKIVDWGEDNDIEMQSALDLPYKGVIDMCNHALANKISTKNMINSEIMKILKSNKSPVEWWKEDSLENRKAIGQIAGQFSWFKNITLGELLGNIIFNHYDEISEDARLKKSFNNIMNWIDEY